MKEKYTNRAWRINHIRTPYDKVPETALAITAKQIRIIDVLIDQLINHELYSNTIVSGHSNYTYRISLRHKYPKSDIRTIKINFNRFNMSLHMFDTSGEHILGTFRFKTNMKDGTEGTITTQFHFSNDDDIALIDELKLVFYETEQIFSSTDTLYHEYDKNDANIDLDKIKFVDLCKLYCENIFVSNKLSRHYYHTKNIADMSAREFHDAVDLNILKDLPGIGNKTCDVIKQIYKFYNFDGR